MPHWICQCSVHCKPIRFKLDVITCICSHGGGTCTVWLFRYYRFTYGHFHHSKSTSPIQSLYQTLRFVQGVRLRQYVGSLNTAREKVKDRTAWLRGLTGQYKDPRGWFEFCSLWTHYVNSCSYNIMGYDYTHMPVVWATDMHKIVWAIKITTSHWLIAAPKTMKFHLFSGCFFLHLGAMTNYFLSSSDQQ